MKCVPHSVLNCFFFSNLRIAFYNTNPETCLTYYCSHSCTDSYDVVWLLFSILDHIKTYLCSYSSHNTSCLSLATLLQSSPYRAPFAFNLFILWDAMTGERRVIQKWSNGCWINKGLWAFTRVARREGCVYFSWLHSRLTAALTEQV